MTVPLSDFTTAGWPTEPTAAGPSFTVYITRDVDNSKSHLSSELEIRDCGNRDFKICNSHVFSLMLSTPFIRAFVIEFELLLANADVAWRLAFENHMII